MKRISLLAMTLMAVCFLHAQDEEEEPEKIPFKQKLFTGGSISLSFSNNSFLIGGSPVFGYNLTRWADVGVVANYTYASYHDYFYIDDKVKQNVYGGGVFTRLFPVRFLFAQVQYEHNFTKQKYTFPGATTSEVYKTSANSVLVGGGYTNGRDPDDKNVFYYFAILFDITKVYGSPYIDVNSDGSTRAVPIVRAGIQVPLFQGRD